MSALGQKRTYAAQQVMPLYPDSDRESGFLRKVMSKERPAPA
jgi:hypothetical protein